MVGEFNSLKPGFDRWMIRDTIIGVDKGDKINDWCIKRHPDVYEAMDVYINEYWRNTHEIWTEDSPKKLTVGLLFPSAVPRLSLSDHVRRKNSSHLGALVTKICKRAQIPRHRAHAHAFRKGVVTELLRAGNPLKTVSHYVHHQRMSTTDQFYDKRNKEELLEKMVVPMGWEKLSNDLQTFQDHDNENVSSTAGTHTDDRENMVLISDAMEMTENFIKLKEKHEIILSLLSEEMKMNYIDACNKKGIKPEL